MQCGERLTSRVSETQGGQIYLYQIDGSYTGLPIRRPPLQFRTPAYENWICRFVGFHCPVKPRYGPASLFRDFDYSSKADGPEPQNAQAAKLPARYSSFSYRFSGRFRVPRSFLRPEVINRFYSQHSIDLPDA
jgi:hypothetical protein